MAFPHEYPQMAMENASISCFSDYFLTYWREGSPLFDKIFFASGLAHELSHHWFGNNVTPKWWDDIWLNQSFADYISYRCLEAIQPNITTLPYPNGLPTLLSVRESSEGTKDDRLASHAVHAPVPNMSLVPAYFDGIIYQKGSQILKQLTSVIG